MSFLDSSDSQLSVSFTANVFPLTCQNGGQSTSKTKNFKNTVDVDFGAQFSEW